MGRFAMTLTLLLCGCSDAQKPFGQSEQFLVTIPEGEVRALADATTYVFLAAVGAGGQAVTFTASNLPAFAVLTGETIAISPNRSQFGSYDVTITAAAGASSDSKVLHLVVEAPNRVPEAPMLPILTDGVVTNLSIAGNASDRSCMLSPRLVAAVEDLDGDRVKLEFEVVRSGTPFAETVTQATSWGVQGGHNGLYSSFDYELQDLVAGEEYDIAFRYRDETGGLGRWIPLVSNLTCVPIGVRGGPLQVYSGETATLEFELLGVGSDPYTLTVIGLPPYATLSGTTLTVTAPTVSSVRTFPLSVTLASRGFEFRMNEMPLLYIRP